MKVNLNKPLQINIYLSAERALELGLTQWGDGTLEPSEEQLLGISEEEREALDGYIAGAIFAARLHVSVPDWEGVVSALRERITENARVKAEREQAIAKERKALLAFLDAGRFYDPETLRRVSCPHAVYAEDETIAPLLSLIQAAAEDERRELVLRADAALTREDKEGREKVFSAARNWRGGPYDPEPPRALEFQRLDKEEAARSAVAEKAANRSAIADLLARKAPDKLDRFGEDVLPEEELTPIVEDHLFEMFDYPTKFARYQFLTEDDIEHLRGCQTLPKFKSEPYGGTFDQDEWLTLKQVEEKAPEDATVEVREHRAWCGACMGDITKRYSIRVSRSFAGKLYHRLLALS